MSATINGVFADAMSLDADARLELVERLWDAVQPQADSVFSQETWNEIGNRVTASDSGQVEHIPGNVAFAQIRAEFGMPSAG